VTATPYGRAAADLLAAQVGAAKAGDPLAPVTVIVPATYAGISARRHLAVAGVAGVTFLTLARLAERLGGPVLAGSGRRPVSPALVTAAVRRVLAERPGVFAPVAGHPATEEALAAAHAELRGVSGPALDRLARSGRRASDVVTIHRAVERLLAPAWHDEHDLIAAAADRAGAPGVLAELGALIVHLPQRVAPATATLLATVADHTTVVVNVGLTGDPDGDSPVIAGLARAGIAVPPPAWRPARPGAVISASDPDDEVRAAVRAVVDAARSGVPWGRMAVVWGAAEPYARIVDAQLAAADIPSNGTPVRTVADSVAGRALLAVLGLGDRRFRRPDVMAVIADAGVVDGRGHPVPGRAWERISREAGVVEGDDWARRLGAHAARLSARADEDDAEDRAASAGQRRRDAASAAGLAAFVGELRSDLERVAATGTWRGMATATAALLDRLLGGAPARIMWPDEEQRAADRVDAALAGLGGLDTIGGPPPTLDVFRRSLAASLSAALRRSGRFGEGVLVGPLSVVTGLDLDVVIVLGLAEGTLPAAHLEDSLLPDRERAATGGELGLRADAQHEERHRYLAALAAADRSTVCFPRGDLRRRGDRVASRWLLDALAEAVGRPAVTTSELATLGGVAHVPSFLGGIRRAGFAATGQEHSLQRLLAGDAAALADDAVVVAGAALVRARAAGGFTRYDGNLAGAGVPRPSDVDATSATRLETWAACPFRYFAEAVLGVILADEPERIIQMTPLDRGSMIHEILDRFVRGAIAGEDHDRTRMERVAEQVFADYDGRGVTGRPLFWRRDRAAILRDLSRFLDEDAGLGTTPLRTELRFGPPDPVVIDLPGGRALRFRGAADRIDARADGSLLVIDYKTGSPRHYAALTVATPTAGATRFQLPVYALAARAAVGRPDAEVEASYWFLPRDGRSTWIGFTVDEHVLEEVSTTLGEVDALIGEGVFPAIPTKESFVSFVECRFCDPDELGTGPRRRRWEAKRDAPELAQLTELLGDR